MTVKEFVRTPQGFVFTSDARDIATPFSQRQEVYDWAGKNGITIEYQGTLGGVDVWRVRNESQRAWFALKWA